MPAVCHHLLPLPLVSQPSLPDLPAGSGADVAHQAARVAAPGSLFSGDLHLPRSAPERHAPAPVHALRPALPQFGDGLAAVGRRSALSGWADWAGGRAADLDARSALPSAHS